MFAFSELLVTTDRIAQLSGVNVRAGWIFINIFWSGERVCNLSPNLP